ncbi:MAG: GHKL domain-containing protein [Rhizobiales bacterium]|nr:GHKL domain-containing protein [Hyphomicrobiales bacterium]
MDWLWKRTRQESPERIAIESAGGDGIADIIAALPDPALILDPLLNVTAGNALARTVLEFDPVGRHLSAAIRAPAVLDAAKAALTGHDPVHVDYDVPAPVQRTFSAHIAAIGSTGALLIVLRDLTREQQIERMRADFIANASHELRTPLAALSGFVETMQGAAKGDAEAAERFLDLMRGQAERMKRLIDDLLSLSRIEMNEHLRPSASVDLGRATRHAADAMSEIAKAEGCELRISIEEPLVVTGNWDELVQVMQNLIENALKYGGSGKLIEIEGRAANGMAEISVRDHGPGIAAEHIPRLTERFYRVSVNESRQRGGTGLGLAIVKHILNRHEGRLTIQSAPGKGSRFSVQLPLRSNK